MSASGLENEDSFEACRTCGIFFLASSNYLRSFFAMPSADTDSHSSEMMLIRMQLAEWNVKINESDGFPQYICTNCIHEFQKIFKFRRSCINIQQELREMYNVRQENKIKIKTELPDAEECQEDENLSICCDFIYVDDLSDTECDGGAAITPFNIPHVPIKEELIEEATVPTEIPATKIEAAGEEDVGTDKIIYTQRAQQKAQPFELNVRYAAKSESPQHNNTAPGPAETLRCNLCLHVVASLPEMHQHMQRIHEVKNIECHICGKEFKNSTANRLKFHLRWHKISKHVKCIQCGFYCNSRDTLKQHMRAMHTKISCNLCGKSITSKRFKSHMRKHAITTSWECSYCKMIFNSETSHEEHLWQEHGTEGLKSGQQNHVDSYGTCIHCKQMFESQQELELHMIQQHFCSSNAEDTQSIPKSNDNADDIFIEGHSNTEIPNDYCADLTEQSLAASKEISLSNLVLEESIAAALQEDEHQEKDIPTEQFDEIFENPDNANEIESNRCAIACANCPQLFSSVDELIAHHQEHLKVRPLFQCQICNKSFDLKFSLNRHLKKHKKSTL